MPGGVDIHAHIAGPKVNAARRLSPEEHRGDAVRPQRAILRSGTGGTVPSTFVTGYRYALLGYTTVVEAATPPLAARHVLAELRDTPMIDAAFLLLMGNNLALFDLIRRDPARVRDAVAWWLEATGGYGVKLVNPGGVERWKHGNGNVSSLDDDVAGVTPRAGDRGDRRRGARARAPAPRPRPLQQPRHRGQPPHDAGHAAHARGPPRAPRAPPVPRLRRQAGRAAALARAGARRVPRRAPRVQRRRRPGDVRRRDDDDRRRAGVRACCATSPTASGSTPTPRSRPAAGSCRSPTARRTTCTRCSGASGSSCSCSAATRGGSCSRPTIRTAARSSATRSSSAC